MSPPSRQDARLAALWQLLQERRHGRDMVVPIESVESYPARHLAEVDPVSFAPLIEFLDSDERDPTDEPSVADRLAERLLLEQYAAAVRRLRTIASATGMLLDRAAPAIREAKHAVRKLKPRDSTTPK